MDIFINLWNNWTQYEKISMLIILVAIIFVIPISIKLFTQKIRLSVLSILSLLLSGFITILAMWFTYTILKVSFSSVFLLVPIIISFVNISSIGTLVGAYKRLQHEKNFSKDILQKEFLTDTIQLSTLLVLLFTVMSVFAPSAILAMFIISGGVSLLSIWINYLLFHKIGF